MLAARTVGRPAPAPQARTTALSLSQTVLQQSGSTYTTDPLKYPLSAPSYLAAFDDGPWVQQELQEASHTWRSEKWPQESDVLILDHDHGKSTVKQYDNAGIAELLRGSKPPQIRFVLLAPTNQEKIQHEIQDPKAAKVYYSNDLLDDPSTITGQTLTWSDDSTHNPSIGSIEHIIGGDEKWQPPPREASVLAQLDSRKDEVPSQINISREALLSILTKYDIAPLACSHIRGQEQTFGSRVCRDKDGGVVSFETWFAIRARSYFPIVKGGKEADLKMTIVSRYDVQNRSNLIILKYRSFNDLTERLKRELISKLKDFVCDSATSSLAADPFSLPLWHFNATVQYFRRAARIPRDAIREQERKAHGGADELAGIDLQLLHLVLGSLDQDKIQIDFSIDALRRLRAKHDLFYKVVPRQDDKSPSGDPGWLYHRVQEELDRYECQFEYFKSLVEDVSSKGQRLLNLSLNLQSRTMAEQTYRQTEHAWSENVSMKTIAVMTMMFLPASFVTGLLGTNLFYVSSDGDSSSAGQFLASPQLWILFAIALPLTVFTFVGWHIWSNLQKRKGKRKEAGTDTNV